MNPAYFKISKHLQDYLAGDKQLQSFYNASLEPDWQALAEKVAANFKAREIVDELVRQNESGTDKAVNKNCQLLKDEKTLVIITGQQLGLLLSPLYIIYKSLTTIWLAEKLNKANTGYNFVPVFWLEGEDHDFDEVKSLTFHEMHGTVKSLNMQEDPAEQGKPMNKRQLSSEITGLLDDLKNHLQPTDFSDDLFNRLQESYQPGKNWLEAFKSHMSQVFKESGLLFFNAGSDKIKQLSKSFFREMLENNDDIVSAFAEQSARLEKKGYANQVNVQQEKAYLFFTKNGPRQSLLYSKGIFHLKETDETFSQNDLLTILDQNPQWFSSTVLSRPLWQSYLLPVVSYVAGGAEIAYWGQLKSGFEKMNIVMPHLQPRHSVTLIEPKIERLLNKYELDVNQIPDNKEEWIKAFFAHTSLGAVTDALSDFKSQTEQSNVKVRELIKLVDPTLEQPAAKSYDAILNTIDKLHNRLAHTISEKEGTIHKHLTAIHESLLPNDTLQERVISPVYFENKYGPEWIKKVSAEINENFVNHIIVRL